MHNYWLNEYEVLEWIINTSIDVKLLNEYRITEKVCFWRNTELLNKK